MSVEKYRTDSTRDHILWKRCGPTVHYYWERKATSEVSQRFDTRKEAWRAHMRQNLEWSDEPLTT